MPRQSWLELAQTLAGVVLNALLHGEPVRCFYRLHAWVIMSNHIHAIFQRYTAMPTIMQ